MGRQYFPVAYDAIELCRRDERLEALVCDLYRSAHRLRWGWVPIGERDLCVRFRVGNRKVWDLLSNLEAEQLAVVRKGRKGHGSTIRFTDPTIVTAGLQLGVQQQETTHTKPVNGKGAAVGAAVGVERVTALTETEPIPNRTDHIWESVHGYYLDGVCRALGKKKVKLQKSKGLGAVLARLVKKHGEEDSIKLLRWWATSSHDRAKYLREKDLKLPTILSHSDEYLSFANDGAATNGSKYYDSTENDDWVRNNLEY